MAVFDLEAAGRILKEARERQDLSIDDASLALCLRKTLVTAIEKGNWDALPHPVYVRGYVQQYAAFLKVQPEIAPFLKVQPEIEPVPVEQETPEAPQAAPSPVVAVQAGPPSRRRITVRPLFSAVRRSVGWPVVYGSMAILLVVMLVLQNSSREISVIPQLGMVAKTTFEGANKGMSSSEMKKLVIACRERTWVRIVIDETEKKEFMLNPEEVVMFTAKEQFDLLIGNAGGVSLYVNGQDTGFNGVSGEVKRVKLP